MYLVPSPQRTNVFGLFQYELKSVWSLIITALMSLRKRRSYGLFVHSGWTGLRSAGRKGSEPVRVWRRRRGGSARKRRSTWGEEAERRSKATLQEAREETRKGTKESLTWREYKRHHFLCFHSSSAQSPSMEDPSCRSPQPSETGGKDRNELKMKE